MTELSPMLQRSVARTSPPASYRRRSPKVRQPGD